MISGYGSVYRVCKHFVDNVHRMVCHLAPVLGTVTFSCIHGALLTTGAETGTAEPPAKATAVMVWVPGVDGAVKVKEKSETPTLAKLLYRCAKVCAAAAVPALVANDVAVELLTGTSGVVPITAPSTWQHSISWCQPGPWSSVLLPAAHTNNDQCASARRQVLDARLSCYYEMLSLKTEVDAACIPDASTQGKALAHACGDEVHTRILTPPVGGTPSVDSALPLMVVEPPAMTGFG